MSVDRDVTRAVRSWLHEDAHENADRVLDLVLDQLDTSPQRLARWPARRTPHMQTYLKLLVAAAAVVVLAVIGANLLPRAAVGPGVTPSPSPTRIASPAASTAALPAAGELAVGTVDLAEDDVRFSLDIQTEGWSSSGVSCSNCVPGAGWLQKGPQTDDAESAWMPIWSVNGVYLDPCTHEAAPAANSIDELAAAVAKLPGMDTTGPTDVTVGGLPAKHVVLGVSDIGCDPTQYYPWYDDIGCRVQSVCGRSLTARGSTIRVWIVDTSPGYVWIEAETYQGSSPALEAEIQRMIDSIQFN